LNNQEKTACIDNGGLCSVDVDGYYIEAAINVVYGIIWYQLGKETIKYLQEVPLNDWRVLTGQPKTEKTIKPEMWREVKERY
jgi:MFS transporter, PAT family, solute carrier family 33 (acetyl-CoA transportor), member 1